MRRCRDLREVERKAQAVRCCYRCCCSCAVAVSYQETYVPLYSSRRGDERRHHEGPTAVQGTNELPRPSSPPQRVEIPYLLPAARQKTVDTDANHTRAPMYVGIERYDKKKSRNKKNNEIRDVKAKHKPISTAKKKHHTHLGETYDKGKTKQSPSPLPPLHGRHKDFFSSPSLEKSVENVFGA